MTEDIGGLYATIEYRDALINAPHCRYCGSTLPAELSNQQYCNRKHARRQAIHRQKQAEKRISPCPTPQKVAYTYRGTAVRAAAWHRIYFYECCCGTYHLTSTADAEKLLVIAPIIPELCQRWIGDVMAERQCVFVIEPQIAEIEGQYRAQYPGVAWSVVAPTRDGALAMLEATEAAKRANPMYLGHELLAVHTHQKRFARSTPGVTEIPLTAVLEILNNANPTAALNEYRERATAGNEPGETQSATPQMSLAAPAAPDSNPSAPRAAADALAIPTATDDDEAMAEPPNFKAARPLVGELITIVRESLIEPLSASDLAKAIGVVPTTVKKIESGSTWPHSSNRGLLQFVLGLRNGWLEDTLGFIACGQPITAPFPHTSEALGDPSAENGWEQVKAALKQQCADYQEVITRSRRATG